MHTSEQMFGSKFAHFGQSLARFTFRAIHVVPVPALSDNYMYLLIDTKTNEAAVVDPVEPAKAINVAKEHGAKLNTILTTHHHWYVSRGVFDLYNMIPETILEPVPYLNTAFTEGDAIYDATTKLGSGIMSISPPVKAVSNMVSIGSGNGSGGNAEMVNTLSDIKVYGGDNRIEGLTDKVKHGHKFMIGDLNVECIFTPCHTAGHICYYVTDKEGNKIAFTGDTLFIAGCGKFFEGTAEQMYEALVDKLGNLPDDTKVYCGHEYTVTNLKFAKYVDPTNPEVDKKMKWSEEMRKNDQPTVPSSIGEEKQYNPFMRVLDPKLQERAKTTDPVRVMYFLRNEKDKFKS